MLSSCLRRSGVALSGSLSALRAPQLLRVSSAVSQPQRFFSTSTTVTASPRGFLNRMSACRTPLPVLATLAQPRRHFGSVDFALADIGEGIAEVEIMQWMVEEGDYVKEFQELCEVQSDKATVTITSRYEGTVKEICYAVGEMASVGTALVKMEVEGEGDSSPSSSDAAPAAAAAAAPSSSSSPSSAASPSSTPPPVDFSTTNAEVRASPAVRHLAKQHNIDLRLVVGTGPKGRIVKHDVNQVISGAVPIATAAPTGGIAAAAVDDAPHTKLPMRPAFVAPIGEDVEVPVTGLARLMVKSMDAANKVPQFGYAGE
jgi:2-oxoisovalerate dehydrogenase E2 component (dihydrolipoyl transacylase)